MKTRQQEIEEMAKSIHSQIESQDNQDCTKNAIQNALDKRAKIEASKIDTNFLIDQLTNSMEFYDKDYFVSYISEQTSFSPEQLSKIFNSFWQIDPITRMNNTPEQWNEFINSNL